MEAGLRMSRSSGCCERQAQERQRAICAVAMGSLTRDLLQSRNSKLRLIACLGALSYG